MDSNTNWLLYSVDILLSHFQRNTPLEIKDNSTTKFNPLHYNIFNNNKNDKMIIEEDLIKDNVYDKNGYILDFVKQYNSYLKKRQKKSFNASY